MDNEYQILSHIEKDKETSQRKIASKTGLSLGTVNILLRKMIKKGLIKVEGLNSKTLQYIITPQGMLEKSQKTYRYIKSSYKQIIKLSNALLLIYENEIQTNSGVRKIYFYGPKDEVLEILKNAANENNIEYFYTKDVKKIDKEDIVITWITEYYEELLKKGYKTINILNYV